MKKNELTCARRRTSIGGQALMEGIMMRGPAKNAMAVRKPSGEIYFEENANEKKKRAAITRAPIIRGVFNFVDSMVVGYKSLMRSADIAMEEEEKTADGSKNKAPSKGVMNAVMVIATVLGVALALLLFMWLPTFLYSVIARFTPDAWDLSGNRYLRSVFEGLLKIVVLVVYMALVSLMKDIRRTFMYHGAEHKTIFCYEQGLPLTVENVKKQKRFHPRCGTSFLILMLLVSIGIGLLIPPELPFASGTLYTVIRAGIKLLLLPLVMGIGYELLKLAGRHDNIITRIISAPGMWLQRITVKEPTDDMIECAVKAFLAVLPEDEIEKETLAAYGAPVGEEAENTEVEE